jgi:hypothetical protein
LATPMDSGWVPMPPPQFSGWRVAAFAAFGNHNSSACVGWSRAFEDFGMPLFGPQSSGCASATTWLEPCRVQACWIAGRRCRLVLPRLVLRRPRRRAASALRVETLRDLRDVDSTIRSSMAPVTSTATGTMLAPTAAAVTAAPTLVPTPRLLRTQRWCLPSALSSLPSALSSFELRRQLARPRRPSSHRRSSSLLSALSSLGLRRQLAGPRRPSSHRRCSTSLVGQRAGCRVPLPSSPTPPPPPS